MKRRFCVHVDLAVHVGFIVHVAMVRENTWKMILFSRSRKSQGIV